MIEWQRDSNSNVHFMSGFMQEGVRFQTSLICIKTENGSTTFLTVIYLTFLKLVTEVLLTIKLVGDLHLTFTAPVDLTHCEGKNQIVIRYSLRLSHEVTTLSRWDGLCVSVTPRAMSAGVLYSW